MKTNILLSLLVFLSMFLMGCATRDSNNENKNLASANNEIHVEVNVMGKAEQKTVSSSNEPKQVNGNGENATTVVIQCVQESSANAAGKDAQVVTGTAPSDTGATQRNSGRALYDSRNLEKPNAVGETPDAARFFKSSN